MSRVLDAASLIDRLERAMSQLREGNEQETRIMGLVAHDLRNPLNSIIMASQLLESEEPDEVAKLARRIEREGRDMNDLIGRFLETAAIESGQLKAELEEVEVTGVARHVIERHEARAREKNLALELILPEVPVTTTTDPRFLREILDNLLSNAVKFSPPGRVVRLEVFLREGAPCVSVADEGPGFSPEDREKLFGRYAKLSARPTGGEKSTGLGLSIVRYMVDQLNADLRLESDEGRGATFTLELPRA